MAQYNFIKECHENYLSTFPENWLSSIDFQTKANIQAAFDKIEGFYERSFILLSKSCICGEYISLETFDIVISEFIKDANFESFPEDEKPTESIALTLYESFINLNKCISNSLGHYKGFLEFAKNKFDNIDQNNRYSSYRTKYTVDSTDNLLKKFEQYTLPVCIFDYRFPANDDKFHELLHISLDLQELYNSSNDDLKIIYNTLKYKCNYIIRRTKKEIFYFSVDFNVTKINPLELELGPLSNLLNHEEFSDSEFKDKVISWLADIKKSEPELASFVMLMKYYKETLNIKSDVSKMDSVINSFEYYYKQKSNISSFNNPKTLKEDYDRFSLNTVLNYIYNCRLSFLSTKGNLTLKEMLTFIRKIDQIQATTNVNNFHPYKKAIESLFKYINTLLDNPVLNVNLVDECMTELDDLLSTLKVKLIWSQSHKFFPFQLSFDESICVTDDINIFTPCTYAKNIDYEVQFDILDRFVKEKNYLIFQKRLSIDRQEIEKDRLEIELIKTKIESSDKKAIELLGIFAGIITFLFGTINIFVENKDVSLSQLIVNTSGLGFILLLFLSLLLLLSPVLVQQLKVKDFFKSRRFAISLIFVFVYAIAVISLIRNSNSSEAEDIKKSFKLQNERIDSLKSILKGSNNSMNVILYNDTIKSK